MIDPVLVTEAIPDGRSVFARAEPMLEAVRALVPSAQLAWGADGLRAGLLRLRRQPRAS